MSETAQPAPTPATPLGIESVDPDLRPALAKLPTLDNSRRIVRLLGRFGARRLLRAYRVPGVTVEWRRDGPVWVRIYRPRRPGGGGLLWIHGGGLVIGSAKQDDRLCAETAAELGVTVVSVEYRLAPESPFPAALDDALAAWHWMRRHATDLSIDPDRIALGGESAGAGIAAALAQRLRDEGGPQPVAQWLFAPMLDDRTAARRDLDAVDHPVWNNAANRFGWTSYLGAAPGAAPVPTYAVPARVEDLAGVPPAWLCVGDIELFHDEVADYAGRLAAAGVPVVLDVVPGGAHGFENWAAGTALAKALTARARAWLADQGLAGQGLAR